MREIDSSICDKCGIPSLKSHPVLCPTCLEPSAKRYRMKRQENLKVERRLYRKYHPFKVDNPGEDVTYHMLHVWVARNLGKPKLCKFCGKTEGKFDWSNISGEYKIDLQDWQRLCHKCHMEYDNVAEKRKNTMLEKYGTISPILANKIKQLK